VCRGRKSSERHKGILRQDYLFGITESTYDELLCKEVKVRAKSALKQPVWVDCDDTHNLCASEKCRTRNADETERRDACGYELEREVYIAINSYIQAGCLFITSTLLNIRL